MADTEPDAERSRRLRSKALVHHFMHAALPDSLEEKSRRDQKLLQGKGLEHNCSFTDKGLKRLASKLRRKLKLRAYERSGGASGTAKTPAPRLSITIPEIRRSACDIRCETCKHRVTTAVHKQIGQLNDGDVFKLIDDFALVKRGAIDALVVNGAELTLSQDLANLSPLLGTCAVLLEVSKTVADASQAQGEATRREELARQRKAAQDIMALPLSKPGGEEVNVKDVKVTMRTPLQLRSRMQSQHSHERELEGDLFPLLQRIRKAWRDKHWNEPVNTKKDWYSSMPGVSATVRENLARESRVRQMRQRIDAVQHFEYYCRVFCLRLRALRTLSKHFPVSSGQAQAASSADAWPPIEFGAYAQLAKSISNKQAVIDRWLAAVNDFLKKDLAKCFVPRGQEGFIGAGIDGSESGGASTETQLDAVSEKVTAQLMTLRKCLDGKEAAIEALLKDTEMESATLLLTARLRAFRFACEAKPRYACDTLGKALKGVQSVWEVLFQSYFSPPQSEFFLSPWTTSISSFQESVKKMCHVHTILVNATKSIVNCLEKGSPPVGQHFRGIASKIEHTLKVGANVVNNLMEKGLMEKGEAHTVAKRNAFMEYSGAAETAALQLMRLVMLAVLRCATLCGTTKHAEMRVRRIIVKKLLIQAERAIQEAELLDMFDKEDASSKADKADVAKKTKKKKRRKNKKKQKKAAQEQKEEAKVEHRTKAEPMRRSAQIKSGAEAEAEAARAGRRQSRRAMLAKQLQKVDRHVLPCRHVMSKEAAATAIQHFLIKKKLQRARAAHLAAPFGGSTFGLYFPLDLDDAGSHVEEAELKCHDEEVTEEKTDDVKPGPPRPPPKPCDDVENAMQRAASADVRARESQSMLERARAANAEIARAAEDRIAALQARVSKLEAEASEKQRLQEEEAARARKAASVDGAFQELATELDAADFEYRVAVAAAQTRLDARRSAAQNNCRRRLLAQGSSGPRGRLERKTAALSAAPAAASTNALGAPFPLPRRLLVPGPPNRPSAAAASSTPNQTRATTSSSTAPTSAASSAVGGDAGGMRITSSTTLLRTTTSTASDTDKRCAICWERPRNAVLVHADKTGHAMFCRECVLILQAKSRREEKTMLCPQCQVAVVDIISPIFA